MVANVQTMMYVGETPWHGKGTKLNNPATAEEAIVAGGLDWEVYKSPLYYSINGEMLTVPNKSVTVRSDNNKSLGVVGDRYSVLQNKNAFSFFDAIVGEKAAMYHTAGVLGEGERIWLLAKVPGHIRVVGDDIVEKFMLLTNSHEGTSSVQVMMTPIRVVCQNTLNAAINSNTNVVKLRHTQSIGMKIEDVRYNLNMISGYYSQFEELSQRMANIELNKTQFEEYIKSIGIVTPDEDKKLSTRAENILNEVTKLFEHGRGNDMTGVKGTLWGAYNAVTEYADYVRVSRNESNRAKSILFGSGAQLKQRAWDNASRIAVI